MLEDATVQEKLQAARRQQPTDACTGQPLFKPQLSTGSATFVRCTSDVPVGDYLYAQRLDHCDRRRAARMRAELGARAESMPARLNPRSARILQEVKARRFWQVFDLLARGAKELQLLDVVSGKNHAFGRLTAEVRADVEGAAVLRCTQAGLCAADVPVHDADARRSALDSAHAELQCAATNIGSAAQCTQVDAQQFADLMGSIVSLQPAVPRAYLLPDSHCRHEDAQPSFKPAINRNSAVLAENRWRNTGKPVHHQLHEHAKAVKVCMYVGNAAWFAVSRALMARFRRQELCSLSVFAPMAWTGKTTVYQSCATAFVKCLLGHCLLLHVSWRGTNGHSVCRHAKRGSRTCITLKRWWTAPSSQRPGIMQGQAGRLRWPSPCRQGTCARRSTPATSLTAKGDH